jgi:prepilin-type N-terminal cleavage/methylation domain-containing protein
MINKIKSTNGYSLVEIILVILIIGIAIPPIIHLFTYNLSKSVNSEFYTKAAYFAEEKMETILADKRSSSTRGYEYIVVSGRYQIDNPVTGFARSVSIDTSSVYSGVRYAKIMVTIAHSNIEDVVLTTWVTDHE